MKKTVIIGGSGFVGSRLLSGVDTSNFSNFDKNQSPFFSSITTIGDVRNQKDLDKALTGVEYVVLLAAEHRDDVSPTSLYYDVNVEGTLKVLRAMDKNNVKHLFFTSSVAVYGLNKDNPDENHPIDPFNHYGQSKWQAEVVIKDWYEKDPEGKSITIVRPTVIFGERNRGNVYNLLRQISSGKFMMIGKGENKKSMAYVGNVVSFINNSINQLRKGFHVYNYVDSPDLTMNELVSQVEISLDKKIPPLKMPYFLGMAIGYVFDLLAKITFRKMTISSVRVKKFCARTQFDASKVHQNFKAPYSLSEGLDNTLKFEFLEQVKDDVVFYTE